MYLLKKTQHCCLGTCLFKIYNMRSHAVIIHFMLKSFHTSSFLTHARLRDRFNPRIAISDFFILFQMTHDDVSLTLLL